MVTRGSVIDWSTKKSAFDSPSDAELLAMVEHWQSHVPEELSSMIMAEEGTEAAPSNTEHRFVWIPVAGGGIGLYFDTVRRVLITPEQLREYIDIYIENSYADVDEHTARLLDSGNLGVFQTDMKDTLVIVHRVAAAIAVGGIARFTEKIAKRVGAEIVYHLSFLSGFAKDIKTGRSLGGIIKRRSRAYISAIRRTYEEIRRVGAKAAGKKEERRILHAKESCEDCVTYAAKGWQPIGTLPQLGDSICDGNCRCTFEFR